MAKTKPKTTRVTITIRLGELERRLERLEREFAEVARKASESYAQTMRIGGNE